MKRAGTIFAVGVLGVAFVSAALAEDVEALVVEGEAVFTRVCFDCHNATEEGPDMVAPPIFAAKNHYSGFAAREDFVAAVSGYLLDPTEQTAQMPGAVRKFGLMPPPDMPPAQPPRRPIRRRATSARAQAPVWARCLAWHAP